MLTWAVAGYRDYAAQGDLGDPEAVRVATSAYQLDSDPVARFIAEECITTPHGHVPARTLTQLHDVAVGIRGTLDVLAQRPSRTSRVATALLLRRVRP